jgi:hypothetical protein
MKSTNNFTFSIGTLPPFPLMMTNGGVVEASGL